MKVKSKTFLELILLHSKNAKRTRERLKVDRRLTQDERNIIRGFLHMRDNSNSEALALAQSIKCQADFFVESMRLFLMGATLNNLGKYREALIFFKSAQRHFPKGINDHLEYVILNNIFIIYMNLHRLAPAREILTLMQMLKDLPPHDILRFERLKFSFHIAENNLDLAEPLYQSLSKKQNEHEGYDLTSLLINFYNYGITFDRFDICEKALEDLSTHKKYALHQNFNYMKVLLNHLKTGAPIYILENDFADHQTLLNELRVIRALDQHKLTDLPLLWDELRRENPDTFREGFVFEGFKTVFSRCLERHAHKIKGLAVKEVKESTLSILDAIEHKLLNEESVSKEQLFYYLYGRELENKDDQNRISKYINKLKTSKNLEIVSTRGAYRLVKKAA